jgi:regulator of cell morphogenesis and NO signaling
MTKKIENLITENYIWGAVLYYFGFKFYENYNITLSEVCDNQGLNENQLFEKLEEFTQRSIIPKKISEYPLDSLIAYLSCSHTWFIQYKLPYILHLIQNIPLKENIDVNLIKDLQMLFPLLIEDFIHHIHEEEDTLFHYILNLYEAQKNEAFLSKVHRKLAQNSIQFFALEHNTHDDEMKGIRELTHHYQLPDNAPLHLKVVFQELQALENELKMHAKIEDEILFVKALQTEKQVKNKITDLIKLN